MIKRVLSILIVLALLTSNIQIEAFAFTGDGSVENPYQIWTAEDLNQVRNDLDANYILMNDIDLSLYLEDVYPQEGWLPIGHTGNPFRGRFDGQGYKISGLWSHRGNDNGIGLFGETQSATIKNLGVECNRAIRGWYSVGSIIGYMEGGIVEKCYSEGYIEGAGHTGGLIGASTGNAKVIKSFTHVTVTASYGSAGFIGLNTGEIIECFSSGSVRGDSSRLGGFVESNYGSIVDSYYDVEKSGRIHNGLGEAKTTEEMYEKSMYNGWDFSHTWDIDDGHSYPEFFQSFSGEGQGTSENPYEISNAIELNQIRYDLDAYYILMNDLDLTDYLSLEVPLSGWRPIGHTGNPFRGRFDGQGYKISGLWSHRGNDNGIGLFGETQSASIKNLGVECNGTIKGWYSVGSIIGYMEGGIVEKCYSEGYIEGAGHTGGLIGASTGNAKVIKSFTHVTVTASYGSAGFIGLNTGEIIECFSSGSVRGDSSRLGGFVESNYGSIIDSYYDIQKSGRVHNGIGQPKTTEEMYQEATYTGWNFDTTWSIDEGLSYPRFWESSFSGVGHGTEASPFEITNADQLNEVRENIDAYYILMNDIDLSEYIASFDPVNGWLPIGTLENRFTGHFDGGGYTISGLSIDRINTDGVGLFGFVRGTITGLNILISDGVKGGNSVGGLGGHVSTDSVISNCSVEGYVEGYDGVGGLVGFSYMTEIFGCHSKSDVEGYIRVGGLIGKQRSGRVSVCSAKGNVYGDSDIDTNVGGLIGYAYEAEISECKSSSHVTGIDDVGGLVGNTDSGSISNCFSDASVSGTSDVGGMLGYNYGGLVDHSLSVGSVSGTSDVGGLVGRNNSAAGVVASYYDGDISGQNDTGKGIRKSTSQLKLTSTYTGWTWGPVWKIYEGASYAFLAAFESPLTVPSIYSNIEGDDNLIPEGFKLLYGSTDENAIVTNSLLNIDGLTTIASGTSLEPGLYCLTIDSVGIDNLTKTIYFIVYDTDIHMPDQLEARDVSSDPFLINESTTDTLKFNADLLVNGLISEEHQYSIDQDFHNRYLFSGDFSIHQGQVDMDIHIYDQVLSNEVGVLYFDGHAQTSAGGSISFDFRLDTIYTHISMDEALHDYIIMIADLNCDYISELAIRQDGSIQIFLLEIIGD